MLELRWLEKLVDSGLGAPVPFPGEKEMVLQFRQVIGVTDEIYEATMKPKNIYSEWEDVPTVGFAQQKIRRNRNEKIS